MVADTNERDVKPCRTCGGTDRYLNGRCRACAQAWKVAHKQHIAAWGREYRADNADRIKAAKRTDWHEKKDTINDARRQQRVDDPTKVRAQGRASYARNREKAIGRMKAYYAKNRAAVRAAQRRWYGQNRDRAVQISLNWAKKNPERVREIKRGWIARNPHVRRAVDQNRRARMIKTGGRLSMHLAKKLYRLQRGKCTCCGLPLGTDYHLDHIVPIALGGENIDSNIQLLRRTCNLQKNAKHPIDFMRTRGFLL